MLRISGPKVGQFEGAKARERARELVHAVLERCCPPPVQYHRMWAQTSARELSAGASLSSSSGAGGGGCDTDGTNASAHDAALYVWRAVPPSDAFVALGVATTRTAAPPPRATLRCVPRAWLAHGTAEGAAPPTRGCDAGATPLAPVWDDVGLSGAPGGMWATSATAPLALSYDRASDERGAVGLGLLAIGIGTAPPDAAALWQPRAARFVLSNGDVTPLATDLLGGGGI